MLSEEEQQSHECTSTRLTTERGDGRWTESLLNRVSSRQTVSQTQDIHMMSSLLRHREERRKRRSQMTERKSSTGLRKASLSGVTETPSVLRI